MNNNIDIKDTSTGFMRRVYPALTISADPEAMIGYIKETAKEAHRERVMQDRENMSKFLNNKYNKRRLK